MPHKYTHEQISWLKQHANERDCNKLTKYFNQEFNTKLTKSAIAHKRNRVRHSSPQVTVKRFRYKQIHDDFLRKHGEGTSNEDLTHMFNKQFNTNVTSSSIEHRKSRIGVKNGLDTRFKPNMHYNPNGEFGECGSHIRRCRIGEIMPRRERARGHIYLWIKVSDKFKNYTKNWMPYHRYLWIQHYGEIPKDMNVTFKDGNPLNCSIDNLMLVTRGELAMLNRYGEYGMGEFGLTLAKFKSAVNNKKKELYGK